MTALGLLKEKIEQLLPFCPLTAAFAFGFVDYLLTLLCSQQGNHVITLLGWGSVAADFRVRVCERELGCISGFSLTSQDDVNVNEV